MINFDLTDRVAIVTGGAQGFGYAISERFIKSGAKVIIWDIDEKLSQKGDQASINLKFTDGSVATIIYLSNGHKSYPKETIDVFVSGKILTLNNFKSLRGYGWNSFRMRTASIA